MGRNRLYVRDITAKLGLRTPVSRLPDCRNFDTLYNVKIKEIAESTESNDRKKIRAQAEALADEYGPRIWRNRSTRLKLWDSDDGPTLRWIEERDRAIIRKNLIDLILVKVNKRHSDLRRKTAEAELDGDDDDESVVSVEERSKTKQTMGMNSKASPSLSIPAPESSTIGHKRERESSGVHNFLHKFASVPKAEGSTSSAAKREGKRRRVDTPTIISVHQSPRADGPQAVTSSRPVATREPTTTQVICGFNFPSISNASSTPSRGVSTELLARLVSNDAHSINQTVQQDAAASTDAIDDHVLDLPSANQPSFRSSTFAPNESQQPTTASPALAPAFRFRVYLATSWNDTHTIVWLNDSMEVHDVFDKIEATLSDELGGQRAVKIRLHVDRPVDIGLTSVEAWETVVEWAREQDLKLVDGRITKSDWM